ncbi:MAG: VOC family protein [Actinomycetota bacterium]
MTAPASTITGVNRIGLAVTDLDRSLDFFAGPTGLETATRRTVEPAWRHLMSTPGPVEVASLRGPNATIELVEFGELATSSPIPVQGPGVTHLCFQSHATSELYKRFIDHGAREVSRNAPVDLGGYGVRYGYARDPDGIMFEVEQLDRPPFDASVWVAHVALVSPDIDRLVDFYTAVLGVEPHRRVNKVVGPRIDEVTNLDDVRVRAAWFNTGNMLLELWEYVHPATPPPSGIRAVEAAGVHRFVFEVGDLDAELQRLDAAGASRTGPPVGDPATDGREVYARDPDGNLFGLLELPAGAPTSIDQLRRIDWM